MPDYWVIETTRRDGTVARRFIQNAHNKAKRYAQDLAEHFARKPANRDTRVYEATADEVARLRRKPCHGSAR